MRAASLFALAWLVLFEATPAAATPLSGDAGDSSCAYSSADVLSWTPSAGPLATFLADEFERAGNLFVALGYDANGFWSAEADTGSDACDDCSTLRLVRTSFDGKERKTFVVGQGLDLEEGTAAERRQRLKTRVFKVAASELNLKALKHDYKLELPKHDAEGRIEKFSGWFAQVKKKDGALLRFALVNESQMCWCFPSWRAYTLAEPKPKTTRAKTQ
jgi:hypothetical protein